MKSNNFI